MYTILHLLLLSLRDLKVDIFTQAILLSVRWTKHARDKKKMGSIPRDKLDVKSIWEAEARGPDYVPAFYRSPTGTKEKKSSFRFHHNLMTQDTDSYWYSRWEKCYLYFVTKLWMNVAIRTLLKSVPTQNRRPPPNAMKCFVPPVISGLFCPENEKFRT